LPGILSILIVLPLHESPKFLLINRNDRKGAVKSLEYYQGPQLDNHDASIGEFMKETDSGKRDLSLWKALLEVIKQASYAWNQSDWLNFAVQFYSLI
jgi:hypothetical protein